MMSSKAAFFKSIWWGTLAANLPHVVLVTVITILDGLGTGVRFGLWSKLSPAFALFILVTPIILLWVVTAMAMLLFGFPISRILARWRMETAVTYTVSGALCGLGIGVFFMPVYESYFYSIYLGLSAGAGAGYFWWRHARKPMMGAV